MMGFYVDGEQRGGFEQGVRSTLEAILASPFFVLRLEREPERVAPGASYDLDDLDLASRLSFFLWGTPPDDGVDPGRGRGRAQRSGESSIARRAGCWPILGLRGARDALRGSVVTAPGPLQGPSGSRTSSRTSTRRSPTPCGSRDRALLQPSRSRGTATPSSSSTPDYTFVNERLATHYGMPGRFRQPVPPGRVLSGRRARGTARAGQRPRTLTSLANRTSPVLRGKWVMEVLMGTPPPPPPPGVPGHSSRPRVRRTGVAASRRGKAHGG